MISFPNGKINLGLNVTSKRADGYHDIETVFFPVQIKDVVEVIQSSGFQFSTSGLTINGEVKNNLCIKAYNLLKEDFQSLPPVQIHLHKNIPMGAGLGGGSANGAFMLKALDTKFNLNLTEKQVLDYALQLGSDCPFFIINKPCFAQGRGEILEPIGLNLSGYKIVLVNPGIHVSTKEAFDGIAPAVPVESIKHIIQQPIETWKEKLKNDFEQRVFQLHPEIKNIKEELYNKGAVYAAMTGTGSTVFGILENKFEPNFSFPNNYTIHELVA